MYSFGLKNEIESYSCDENLQLSSNINLIMDNLKTWQKLFLYIFNDPISSKLTEKMMQNKSIVNMFDNSLILFNLVYIGSFIFQNYELNNVLNINIKSFINHIKKQNVNLLQFMFYLIICFFDYECFDINKTNNTQIQSNKELSFILNLPLDYYILCKSDSCKLYDNEHKILLFNQLLLYEIIKNTFKKLSISRNVTFNICFKFIMSLMNLKLISLKFFEYKFLCEKHSLKNIHTFDLNLSLLYSIITCFIFIYAK